MSKTLERLREREEQHHEGIRCVHGCEECNTRRWAIRLAEAAEDNHDKCRLIDREEAERLLAMGRGYMVVPHDECIDAIRAALDAPLEGEE